MFSRLDILIGFFTVCLIMACGDPQDNGQLGQEPSTREPDVNIQPEEPAIALPETDDLSNIFSQKDRIIWQKPSRVIQYLGNLDDKVVADIGAGPVGYFAFIIASMSKKVIAIDIDQNALNYIDSLNMHQPLEQQGRLETRLCTPDDPKIKVSEADVVLIVNTISLIDNRIAYLSNLLSGISENGRLVIVDFKKKIIPEIFPSSDSRLALYVLEQELVRSGYDIRVSDDKSLDYQYIVVATKRKI